MLSRFTVFSSRLPASLSFALFSTTASSSNPSAAYLKKMSVKQFVEDAIKDNKVAIFSKSYCPYCRRVKTLFSSKFPDVTPVIFELDEMENGTAIQEYLYEKTNQRTVPNVFVKQTHIGGSDDTQDQFDSGKLTKLITA